MRKSYAKLFYGNTVAFLPGEVYTSPVVRFVADLTGRKAVNGCTISFHRSGKRVPADGVFPGLRAGVWL